MKLNSLTLFMMYTVQSTFTTSDLLINAPKYETDLSTYVPQWYTTFLQPSTATHCIYVPSWKLNSPLHNICQVYSQCLYTVSGKKVNQ